MKGKIKPTPQVAPKAAGKAVTPKAQAAGDDLLQKIYTGLKSISGAVKSLEASVKSIEEAVAPLHESLESLTSLPAFQEEIKGMVESLYQGQENLYQTLSVASVEAEEHEEPAEVEGEDVGDEEDILTAEDIMRMSKKDLLALIADNELPVENPANMSVHALREAICGLIESGDGEDGADPEDEGFDDVGDDGDDEGDDIDDIDDIDDVDAGDDIDAEPEGDEDEW